MIDQLISFIGKQEGWDDKDPSVVPRRLDNPGDLIYAGQLGATPVKIGNHTFAKFSSPQQGIVACYRQALADIAKGWNLRQLIMSWAPPSDRNNTEAYLANVAKGVGVDPDKPLWDFLVLS
jgi:hypothetical protein